MVRRSKDEGWLVISRMTVAPSRYRRLGDAVDIDRRHRVIG
jgi:hypothetical protein